MKLSEAILVGCKIAPVKIKGCYIKHLKLAIGACTLGAACLGEGILPGEASVKKQWPELCDRISYQKVPIHRNRMRDISLMHLIIFLNDEVSMAREEIANILVSLGY